MIDEDLCHSEHLRIVNRASCQSGQANARTFGRPRRRAGLAREGLNLSGKVAVVTGAARGIGRAIAVELAATAPILSRSNIAGPPSPASNAVPANA